MKRIRRETTRPLVLGITHDPELPNSTEMVLFLENGQISASGAAEALQQSATRYAKRAHEVHQEIQILLAKEGWQSGKGSK